jgi:hypothetical protein
MSEAFNMNRYHILKILIIPLKATIFEKYSHLLYKKKLILFAPTIALVADLCKNPVADRRSPEKQCVFTCLF